MAIIPPLYSINVINNLLETQPIDQTIIDGYLFWNTFLFFSILLYRFTTIIIASDIISGDFSTKSAMLIYSSPVSRSKIVITKIISMVFYLSLLEILSFFIFGIILLIIAESIVSFNIIFLGFLINFLNILFGLSFSLILSATTRKTVISVLIPFLYLYTSPQLLDMFNLELLSYIYHNSRIINVISDFIEMGTLNLQFEDILSIFVVLLIPFLIILITIIIFNKIDIRT
ncbi:MAG: hypothetical protein ACFE9S_10415 [Candidatus Hermodarchaeota archaeon]